MAFRPGLSHAQQLEEINNHIRDSGAPYLGGKRPNARDLELAPKVYHVSTAMRHYKVGLADPITSI